MRAPRRTHPPKRAHRPRVTQLTRPALKPLDATYRARAVPPGTVRYWSWLFAAAESRAPLLGIYALGAEWQALTDPATDISVAHLKLAWWQDEMRRLAAGSALPPPRRFSPPVPRPPPGRFPPPSRAGPGPPPPAPPRPPGRRHPSR